VPGDCGEEAPGQRDVLADVLAVLGSDWVQFLETVAGQVVTRSSASARRGNRLGKATRHPSGRL
jgi:hypothetical protein